jgi:hypothetical protein
LDQSNQFAKLNEDKVVNNEQTIEYMFILKDGFSVKKTFYDDIQQRLVEILPAMEEGCGYTLQALAGDDYWLALDNDHRRLAGRCVADMVENGKVPLGFFGPCCQSPKKYLRICNPIQK